LGGVPGICLRSRELPGRFDGFPRIRRLRISLSRACSASSPASAFAFDWLRFGGKRPRKVFRLRNGRPGRGIPGPCPLVLLSPCPDVSESGVSGQSRPSGSLLKIRRVPGKSRSSGFRRKSRKPIGGCSGERIPVRMSVFWVRRAPPTPRAGSQGGRSLGPSGVPGTRHAFPGIESVRPFAEAVFPVSGDERLSRFPARIGRVGRGSRGGGEERGRGGEGAGSVAGKADK
jgi:hypothetical protein